MKNHWKNRLNPAQVSLIVTALIGIGGLTAPAHAQGESRSSRIIDSNEDGWDDEWTAKYSVDLSEPLADLNGDGMPVYLEMALGLDPYAERGTEKLKLDENSKRLRSKLKRMEQARQRHAPWLNRGLRDEKGKPTTRAQLRRARQADLEEKLDRYQVEGAARDLRIDAFMREHGDKLPQALRGQRPANIVDGRPEWNGALSLQLSVEAFVLDYLWPGGFIGDPLYNWDLTGSGRVIAMWDTGSVDSNHEQFDPDGLGGAPSRITNFDGISFPVTDHATAVAAVLVGAGDPSILEPGILTDFIRLIPFPERARGISYGSTFLVYDAEFDQLEMLELLLDPTIDLRLSNHSYGTNCGWQRLAGSSDWLWHGHLTHRLEDTEEDYKFGAYRAETQDIDDLVHSAQTYLPVWAAGNDRMNISRDAPEPDERGPVFSSQPLEHTVFPVAQPGGTLITDMEADTHDLDRDSDGRDPGTPRNEFDTIRPQACAKNVLTVAQYRFAHGPTDDGRIKPDLIISRADSDSAYNSTPYGEISGSSFAAPVVTGALNLIMELWDQRRGITEDSPLASTMKAIAIAGAGETDRGPSYERGWGCFNAWISAQLVHFDTEPDVLHAHQIIKEASVEDGETIEFHILRNSINEFVGFQFNPPINNSGNPDFNEFIAVTICWTDPEGSASLVGVIDPQISRLENDLDLTIEGPLPAATLHKGANGNIGYR